MKFSVKITQTNTSTVYFETEEEAYKFINEPDYNLCDWELLENKMVLSPADSPAD
tara:strand:+ start:126 stop:290 length:165 start_codon:yes stop_codon:yes gene_type:complete